jgi:hypothetical protein
MISLARRASSFQNKEELAIDLCRTRNYLSSNLVSLAGVK